MVLWLSLSLLLMSCENKTSESNTVQSPVSQDEALEKHESDHHGHADAGSKLSLDNGAKWKVNPEMMVPVRQMQSDIDKFAGKELSEYKTLAKDLTKANEQVIATCTMEGPAHEELHKWLLPFIDLVGQLSGATDLGTASENLLLVKDSMKEFDQFFE